MKSCQVSFLVSGKSHVNERDASTGLKGENIL